MRLSKSKFVAGVQCLKRLYFQVHEPGLGDSLSDGSRSVMAQGRQVGLVAQKLFPGGVTAKDESGEIGQLTEVTSELVRSRRAPAVFEPTFQYAGVLVRVDILEAIGRTGYRLIEVKSSAQLKPHYLYDIAIQRYVLEGSEVDVQSLSLMHLNREYIHDGSEYDVARLFTIKDIERDVAIGAAEISDRLREQFRILNQSKPPDIAPGRHCSSPVRCEFYEHCNLKVPTDHVRLLPRLAAKRVKELLAAGITSMKDIPEAFKLTEPQRRVADCVKTGSLFIGPKLAAELATLDYPLCFMDFETVAPPLPRFAGMAPYDPIPFQWSVHRQERPGAALKHFEFLADNQGDPRVFFMASLAEALAGAERIVVYHQEFEYSRLADLGRWLPQYAQAVESIQARMWDLLAAVRRSVYHPEFGGSYSLKSVLPALVPEMSYRELEVQEGVAAGLAWQRFIDGETPQAEKNQLKRALLAYCRQDTLALARLLEVLEKHS